MINATLWKYFSGIYLKNIISLLFIFLGIVYLFDTVELIRRASDKEGLALGLILQMGLLKLPEVGQLIAPFIILFAAMSTFWQLNKRSELVVIRSAGLSVWQFMAPLLAIAAILGIVQFTLINPISSVLIAKFETLESKHLENKQSNTINLLDNGLWLKQDNVSQAGYTVIHATNLNTQQWTIKNVMAITFNEKNQYVERIDAPQAKLTNGSWIFEDAVTHTPTSETPEVIEEFQLETNLTPTDIEKSFASPSTMSFWNLQDRINKIESTGFDVAQLKVHFHSLLAQPFMFCAMVLLAATVSLRPPRFRGGLFLLVTGITIGFVVFFLSSFLQALGASHQIPYILAAWAPSTISLLLGSTVILSLEDG